MDGDAMEELLEFLTCSAEGADDDQWLMPINVDANLNLNSRSELDLSLSGGSDRLLFSLTSPRFELMDERHLQVVEKESLPISDSSSEGISHSESLPKRRSRKQEIEGLRDQVALLSLELNALKEKAGIDINAPVARVPAVKTRDIVAKASGELLMWERLALKQRERRQISEEENRVLREAMIAHIRRAKRFRNMLSKRAKEESNALGPAISRSTQKLSVVFFLPENKQLLHRFSSEVDAIYSTIDDEFRRAGMQLLPRPGQHSSHSIRDSKRWSIEIKEVRVVPFDFKDVSRMIWKIHGGSGGGETATEVRRSYQFSYCHPAGPTLQISSNNLTRRYSEHEREIIVVRSLMQPAPGVMIDHTNRIIITCGPTSMGSPTTGIEILATGKGETASDLVNAISDMFPVGFDNDFGVGQWTQALSRSIDEVENALLNDSLS